MGISDLIPGVSGGTIAFILGIYDRLLSSISGFFSREWKKQLGFLVPLGAGIGIALLLFSRVIDYLLEYHYEPTQFFFLGLIIGVLPFIAKEAEMKHRFTWVHFSVLAAVAICLGCMAFIKPVDIAVITQLTIPSAIGLFAAGWLASMAMLMPGISGSFILLLVGAYSTIISALSDLNIPIILVVGAGAALGFIISSRAISYLLKHHRHMTYAVIIGLIIGSVFVVYPGIPAQGIWISAVTFIAGFGITNFFSRV